MSRYLCYQEMLFRDRQLLLAALADLGYTQGEEGDHLPLYGYQDHRRPETPALVVRRQHLGPGSNDLGFGRTVDGYFPIISAYDQRTLLGGQLLPKLRSACAERVVETVRQRLRGSLRRTVEGSVVKLRVRYEPVPELEFSLDTASGELSLHIQGIAGPACDDIARLVKELAGEPARLGATLRGPPAGTAARLRALPALAPYDPSLRQLSAREREAWSNRLGMELTDPFPAGTVLWFHARGALPRRDRQSAHYADAHRTPIR